MQAEESAGVFCKPLMLATVLLFHRSYFIQMVWISPCSSRQTWPNSCRYQGWSQSKCSKGGSCWPSFGVSLGLPAQVWWIKLADLTNNNVMTNKNGMCMCPKDMAHTHSGDIHLPYLLDARPLHHSGHIMSIACLFPYWIGRIFILLYSCVCARVDISIRRLHGKQASMQKKKSMLDFNHLSPLRHVSNVSWQVGDLFG